MKKKKLINISLTLIFIILVWVIIFQSQTIRDIHNEVVQMKETIKELETNLNIAKNELSEKDEYISILKNNESIINRLSDDFFDLLYVKLDGKKVCTNATLISEQGMCLETFCKEVWTGMKLEILEYSENKGVRGDVAPVKFRVTLGGKSLLFCGGAYKSANGELVAEYIGGDFGEIRARYKRGLYLSSNSSVVSFLDAFGIAFTLWDDKSIELHK